MAHAIETIAGTLDVEKSHSTSDRLIGLAITAIIPALFWTVVVNFVCSAAGVTLGSSFLIAFPLAVAGFLALVVNALQANRA